MSCSYIAPYLVKHCAVGVRHAKPGITQLIPEDLILCNTCGWLRLSEYHEHLVVLIDDYIRDII